MAGCVLALAGVVRCQAGREIVGQASVVVVWVSGAGEDVDIGETSLWVWHGNLPDFRLRFILVSSAVARLC